MRTSDTAARLGGDEFAALIVGDGTRDQAAREYQVHEIADRLRLRLSQPYRIGTGEVRVAASIGVAFAEPSITPKDLMRNADLAMYRAKANGKGRVELYAPQMQADVVRRSELAARLRTALRDGEFALLHQPVVHLASGTVAAVAAQARWRSAQGILFTPAEFLRVSEDSERAAALGTWLLEEAVEQAADRYRAGHPVSVSVRVSAARLLDRALPPGSVEALLTRHGLPSGALMIEVGDNDPGSPSTSWSSAWSRSAASESGSHSTGSAADTPRSTPCAGFPSTSSSWTGAWWRASSSRRGCTRSPAGCCASRVISACSPWRTGWTYPNRCAPCAPWGAPTARGWPSPAPWTSTGCGAP